MMRRLWQTGAMVFALSLLAGCGGRVPASASLAATTPTTTTTPSYSTPSSYTDPSYGSGYNSTPGYSSTPGYGSTGGYGSTTGVSTPSQPLQAAIDKVKNGSFLGAGKFTVTVKVMNPSATMPQTGMLKVSILSSGKSIKDFNESVSVPAGQTITRTYEDTRWKADNASVSMAPSTSSADPYASYNTPAATAGYGSVGATGPYGY